MRDLPALWRSEEWRAGLEAWLLPALEDAGRRVTGPLVQERVRFWSTVLHVETDAGRVWVKENAPSQGFEARLVAVVDRLAPGAVAPVVAVEEERGWLATADLGLPMWHDETPPPVEDWVAVVADYARTQRALAGHEDELLTTGLPRFPREPDGVVAWVEGLLAELRALPEDDERRLSGDEAAAVRDGLGRIHDAAGELAASALPDALQHNDLHLGNAFRNNGGAAFIDLGDALWTHPLTTARIPLWIMRTRFDLDQEHPDVARTVDAFLDPWTDLAERDELVALLPAADRLSCLHRAESWRRLQADVPVSCVEGPFLRTVAEWLLDAAAVDPYASAVAR
ncbi:hypothetical protein [Oryzobacter telluris]|uniref:hypothetical protein n=1 Tax=Oryzobacter telluris TaxID=3149179 RepID=UPI00370DA7B6